MFGHRLGSCLVLVGTSQKFPRVVVQIIPPTSEENEGHLNAYVVNCYNTPEGQVWVSPPPVHRGARWVLTNLVKPEVRTLPPEWQQVLNYQSIMDSGQPGSAVGVLRSGDGHMREEWLHAQTWGRLWALLLSSAAYTSC